jgi:D-sedoheptulose 7-phosphate isomerase
MNNIEQVYQESDTFDSFASGYFNYLKTVLDSIDKNSLNKLAQEFEDSREKGITLFVAGNGGSAATSTTMANDIGFDIIKKVGTERPFRVFSLTDNTSVITAIANDVGYENIFINQLKIHYREGDSVLFISASGNSENIIRAAEWVKAKNGRIIGLLGFTGGALEDFCDVSVHVPTLAGEYGPVEDAHLIINHLLAHWFQLELKKPSKF